MAAGKTNHVWTLAEIVGLLDYKISQTDPLLPSPGL